MQSRYRTCSFSEQCRKIFIKMQFICNDNFRKTCIVSSENYLYLFLNLIIFAFLDETIFDKQRFLHFQKTL